MKKLKIFGIFATADGCHYLTNRPESKIRYQFSVVRALHDIASEFELEGK